jgi:hypothetical protein
VAAPQRPARKRGRPVTTEEAVDPQASFEPVLASLARVVATAAADDGRWALTGAASCALQHVEAHSPNIELLTTARALHALAERLGVPPSWGRGTHLAAQRLHFTRGGVPVFVFGDPVFHGPYESLAPMEVPSLWDARARLELDGCELLATPLEWELLLAVVLGAGPRIQALRMRLRQAGYDNRLLVRLLRESHVQAATEEAVWDVLERN